PYTTLFRSSTSNVTFMVFWLPTVLLAVVNPIKENCRVSWLETSMEYSPFSDVMVPRVVPEILTFTPGRGRLSSPEITAPVTVRLWAKDSTLTITSSIQTPSKLFFIGNRFKEAIPDQRYRTGWASKSIINGTHKYSVSFSLTVRGIRSRKFNFFDTD